MPWYLYLSVSHPIILAWLTNPISIPPHNNPRRLTEKRKTRNLLRFHCLCPFPQDYPYYGQRRKCKIYPDMASLYWCYHPRWCIAALVVFLVRIRQALPNLQLGLRKPFTLRCLFLKPLLCNLEGWRVKDWGWLGAEGFPSFLLLLLYWLMTTIFSLVLCTIQEGYLPWLVDTPLVWGYPNYGYLPYMRGIYHTWWVRQGASHGYNPQFTILYSLVLFHSHKGIQQLVLVIRLFSRSVR